MIIENYDLEKEIKKFIEDCIPETIGHHTACPQGIILERKKWNKRIKLSIQLIEQHLPVFCDKIKFKIKRCIETYSNKAVEEATEKLKGDVVGVVENEIIKGNFIKDNIIALTERGLKNSEVKFALKVLTKLKTELEGLL